jgi:recombination protein RecA
MAKKDKKKKEKASDFDALKSMCETKHGEGILVSLKDFKVDCEVSTTGSMTLDLALGVGGYPKGRIIEIYGPEASGKTTLALHAVKGVLNQNPEAKAAFIDAEHALDPSYMENIGIDLERCVVSQPDCGEQAIDIAATMAESGLVNIVVVDSVAALTPRAEIDGDMDTNHIGGIARLMSQACRKIVAATKKNNCLVIFINQIRMKIGVMFGSPETTPGGQALKFYSSIRLDIRKKEPIKNKDEFIGHYARVKVVKNKVATPFKVAMIPIMYGEGIDYFEDIFNAGIEYKMIPQKGSWYYVGEEKFAGQEKLKKHLQENPDALIKLDQGIRTQLLSKSSSEEDTSSKNNTEDDNQDEEITEAELEGLSEDEEENSGT